MNCEDFHILIHAKADGGLEPLDEASLSVHLKTCAACEKRLARALRLKDLLSRAAALPIEARPRPWFEAQFWARLKKETQWDPAARRAVRALPVLAGLMIAVAAFYHFSPDPRLAAPLLVASAGTEESLALMDVSRARAKAALERQRVNERSRETLNNLF